jgi:hypothetical protein
MATPKLTQEEKDKRKAEREAAKQQPVTPTVTEDSTPGIDISVEDAPPNTFTEEKKPGVLEGVLTRLGIKDDPKAPLVKAPVTGKLNQAQIQFCDMATPIANSLLIISVGWAWAQLDEDYRALAPSTEAAESIVAPLVRIYARSNKALIRAASPNTVDALMALNGIIMYLHASLTMLHEINAMKREYANESNRPTDIRARGSNRTQETRTSGASAGYPDIQRADNGNAESNVTHANVEPPDNLTERERANFNSLSVLRERDIAARQRRSGRVG